MENGVYTTVCFCRSFFFEDLAKRNNGLPALFSANPGTVNNDSMPTPGFRRGDCVPDVNELIRMMKGSCDTRT